MTPRRILHDRRAVTALEFAFVFPAFILLIVGMFAMYTLMTARRAMDYGIEKALRYAAVNGGSGTSGVTAAYNTAAEVIWRDAGVNSSVSVTPTNFKAGDTVTVSVTYPWVAPAGLKASPSTSLFDPVTLSATGAMRVQY